MWFNNIMPPPDTTDAAYQIAFRADLDRIFGAAGGKMNFKEHISARHQRFANHIVPWVQANFDLSGSVVFEIGSGTGSATLAFAPFVERIHCYDISPKPVAAAKTRLDYFKIDNVRFEPGLFDQDAEAVVCGPKANVVLLIAVLEHMTFGEIQTVLKTAWECLEPGGIIVVAETPNRLSVRDYHTSWVPFFQWLPEEIKLAYIRNSPRKHFVEEVLAIHDQPIASMSLVRWGRGLSFHEFEIVFGTDVHEMIIATGHEAILEPIVPRFIDDEILESIIERLDLKISPAFTRWFLYFILQKPNR